MLRAYSQAAVSLNLARMLGCKGSNAICGLELSLVSSKFHHSSHGKTAMISCPYNDKVKHQFHQLLFIISSKKMAPMWKLTNLQQKYSVPNDMQKAYECYDSTKEKLILLVLKQSNSLPSQRIQRTRWTNILRIGHLAIR